MPRARKPRIDDLEGQPYGQVTDLMRQQDQVEQAFVGPDEVPNLSDPSGRPQEPLTTGLPVGAGAGPEVMQPSAPTPVRRTLQAMLLFDPENHEVMRLIDLLDAMGR